MEQTQNLYVITDQVRQALILAIGKAVHPNSSYEQINGIMNHLETLEPVQVHPDPESLIAANANESFISQEAE